MPSNSGHPLHRQYTLRESQIRSAWAVGKLVREMAPENIPFNLHRRYSESAPSATPILGGYALSNSLPASTIPRTANNTYTAHVIGNNVPLAFPLFPVAASQIRVAHRQRRPANLASAPTPPAASVHACKHWPNLPHHRGITLAAPCRAALEGGKRRAAISPSPPLTPSMATSEKRWSGTLLLTNATNNSKRHLHRRRPAVIGAAGMFFHPIRMCNLQRRRSFRRFRRHSPVVRKRAFRQRERSHSLWRRLLTADYIVAHAADSTSSRFKRFCHRLSFADSTAGSEIDGIRPGPSPASIQSSAPTPPQPSTQLAPIATLKIPSP